jgi:hypothetical protein
MSPSAVPDFRAASPALSLVQELGPLSELPGTWSGHGFNLIARPDFEGGNDIFLELNPTDEHLQFSAIGGAIPNRGSVMDDIELFGVHYLQQISDLDTGGAIHIEPGIWLNVPATSDPQAPSTVVRLATIPHGSAVLAQGSSLEIDGPPPPFKPANTVPFPIGGTEPPPGTPNGFPEYNLAVPNQFRTTPTPAQVTQAMVTNPNSLLTDAIHGQTITRTVVLDVSTATGATSNAFGGTEDIPFLGANAAVGRVSATLWIETVQQPDPHSDRHFVQLQYTQTVLLNFKTLSWPHVTVATLKKVT